MKKKINSTYLSSVAPLLRYFCPYPFSFSLEQLINIMLFEDSRSQTGAN